jgi:hypothetical protein
MVGGRAPDQARPEDSLARGAWTEHFDRPLFARIRHEDEFVGALNSPERVHGVCLHSCTKRRRSLRGWRTTPRGELVCV